MINILEYLQKNHAKINDKEDAIKIFTDDIEKIIKSNNITIYEGADKYNYKSENPYCVKDILKGEFAKDYHTNNDVYRYEIYCNKETDFNKDGKYSPSQLGMVIKILGWYDDDLERARYQIYFGCKGSSKTWYDVNDDLNKHFRSIKLDAQRYLTAVEYISDVVKIFTDIKPEMQKIYDDAWDKEKHVQKKDFAKLCKNFDKYILDY